MTRKLVIALLQRTSLSFALFLLTFPLWAQLKTEAFQGQGEVATEGLVNFKGAIPVAGALYQASVAIGSRLVTQINTIANSDEVFYLGTEGHVHELWYSGGIWNAADPTAAAGAPNAAAGSDIAAQINTIATTDEVFYLGADQHVHELWESSGIWYATDPTAAAGAPNAAAGTNVAVHINTIASTDEVFYLGTDQHVHELWCSSGIWHAADPTAAAGALNAASGSPIVAQTNTIASSDEVFYMGTDRHVHELWCSSGIWYAADPTATAGAPNAAAGSDIAAHVNTIATTDEVFYLGSDRHVHELWCSSGIWHAADPTAAAGALNAASGSPIVAQINTIASSDEVFYMGTDQDVHELWCSSGIWYAADPTATAGAPNAAVGSDIAAHINTIATTDEVFYLGSDQHVRELWCSAGVWYAADVTAAAGL
jgi:hypothetical protein